ncbi:MAG: beta/gamma crystallin-related protein [Pseudomonadota bacterium]
MKRWTQALTTRNSIKAGLLALAALLSVAVQAQAGEITLYEHEGFGGRQVDLRDVTPSLRGIGFNDRASSVVVRSGRWEVCSDNNFQGSCAVLERGEYRNLDPRLNDRISSVREVDGSGGYAAGGGGGYGGGQDRPGRRPVINMYSGPSFSGQMISFNDDAPNLREQGFNDTAISIVVLEGNWVLCSDANYGGDCRTYGPGRYPDLGYGMARAVSSARVAPERYDNRPIHGGGWDRPRRDEDRDSRPGPDNASLVLFSDDGLRGRSMAISGNMVDFSNTDFNDRAASMVIQGGYWEFCSDAYFRGDCRVMGPGQYARLDPALYRRISSVRAAAPQAVSPPVSRGVVELFSASNFGGDRYEVAQDLSSFRSGGFNDRIQSLVIHEGQWEFCTDADYRGRCTVFGPGRYPGLGGLANQLSSMHRIR